MRQMKRVIKLVVLVGALAATGCQQWANKPVTSGSKTPAFVAPPSQSARRND